MTTPSSHVDVLVVGAGPVGLVTAIELTRRGLACRIVDQLAEPVVWSKAQIVHARTQEVLHDLGLTEAFRERGKPMRAFNLYTPALERIARVATENDASRFEAPLSVSQHDTEAILAAHLARLGVRAERPTRLERFEQDATGVTATLAHADGRGEAVRASWLVGCDGSHSAVRKALDLPFEGSTYEQRIVQGDVRIDWSFAPPDDEVMVFLGRGGVLGAFPLPGERRYRLLTFLEPGEALEPTLETFQALMEARGPKGSTVSDPKWMVAFGFHCRMVPRYRVGRVLLAGDAAHIHSPAGGQGMNMGIQDAHNLAWKLALVHRGEARESLLESYEAERRPVAAATLGGTDTATRFGAFMLGLKNPVALELRNQLMGFVTSLEFAKGRAARVLSMLDTAYPDSPVVGQDRPSVWGTAVVGDRSSEAPGLREWLDFGNGPAPGSRAHDVVFAGDEAGGARAGEGPRRLFDLLDGRVHTLLLFDGAAPTTAGYQNLDRIARAVRARHGKHVSVHVVVPRREIPAELGWDGSVALDADGELHRAYSARSECLYLVRPDGYVAYRCQPADGDKLEQYLARVFV